MEKKIIVSSKSFSAEIVVCEANLCFHCLSFFYCAERWENSLILMIGLVSGLLTSKRQVAVFVVKPTPHIVFCLPD